MKTKDGLTYFHVMTVALITEVLLLLVQFLYLNVYGAVEDTDAVFTSEYMKTRGFYIFQIIGFFLYVLVAYNLVGRMRDKILNRLLVLVLTGGLIELLFYLVIQASYEGAFVYSILDKIIAVTFGMILYNYTSRNAKKPESYL